MVMMDFFDGIKMSLPAAVSHANYIVCRVDGGEKPRSPFLFFFFKKKSFYCDDFFCCARSRLSPLKQTVLLCLLQVYRHSYMASYSIYNIHTR